MKNELTVVFALALCGCSAFPVDRDLLPAVQTCPGDTGVPAYLADSFEAIADEQLLNEALGNPDEGKLCQGRVYQSRTSSRVTLFRAWNSTNPGSQFGNWWAFQQPSGKISTYRAEYEICYQWSPLDMLAICTLEPGARVVVGTGQSARCSEYLTYPASEEKQVYIADASTSLTNCEVLVGEFSRK